MADPLLSIKQRFGIIGISRALDHALSTAVRVASTDLSVLITGESGTGKEVFSKIIHSLSARKHNNFIAVNCGAIPEGTINSELFGHEKGAFTGATGERKGYFETVDGGTIFLDEIGEMPLDTQAFLLRVLESGEFLRVGSSKVQKTNVRVIAATNVSLEESIRKGKFREDLYYRLNTVPIEVPPLRERREDIYMLFRRFVVDFGERYHRPTIQLSAEGRMILESYAWPGNIRELKNIAEQISVLAQDQMVDESDLREIVPQLFRKNLPARMATESMGFEEREILYKLLFDMKADLNELKRLLFSLIQSNDLKMPDVASVRHFLQEAPAGMGNSYGSYGTIIKHPEEEESWSAPYPQGNPVFMHEKNSSFENIETVDANLSIEEMEIDMIKKALKKYNSRRKEAAAELGISERTLYRKIKQYNIQE
jgi:transcriptional regulator with PAS, ATPase and Fis domain